MDNDIKITSGGYELLYSGSLIQIANEDIKFELPDHADKPVYLILKFANDINSLTTRAAPQLLDSQTLEIIFYNFNDPTGTANVEILPLGTLQDRRLFLNYRIYSIGVVGKLVHYSFYLGEKTNNG